MLSNKYYNYKWLKKKKRSVSLDREDHLKATKLRERKAFRWWQLLMDGHTMKKERTLDLNKNYMMIELGVLSFFSLCPSIDREAVLRSRKLLSSCELILMACLELTYKKRNNSRVDPSLSSKISFKIIFDNEREGFDQPVKHFPSFFYWSTN